MIKLPKEDGAWTMALTCWIAGWTVRLASPAAAAGAALILGGLWLR